MNKLFFTPILALFCSIEAMAPLSKKLVNFSNLSPSYSKKSPIFTKKQPFSQKRSIGFLKMSFSSLRTQESLALLTNHGLQKSLWDNNGQKTANKSFYTKLAYDPRYYQADSFNTSLLEGGSTGHLEVRKKYQHELSQEAQILWDEISKKVKITKEQLVKLLISYDRLCSLIGYTNGLTFPELNLEKKKELVAIINELGHNAGNILLFGLDMPCVGEAYHKVLAINKDIATDEAPYVMAHELSHILHFDSLMSKAFIDLQLNKELTSRINRFTEKRADIYACTRGLNYCKSAVSYLENNKKYFSDISDTHPPYQERLAIAKSIYEQMKDSK